MPVGVDILACVPESAIGTTSVGSNERFMLFLAWVIRHQLRPRSFRAHLAPADLLALDALALHCGSDALTSMDLRVGLPGHRCMQSMLVPDPNAESWTRVDLTGSASSEPSMSSAEMQARWKEVTVRTIEHSLRHRPSATPTVASVLSRFTCLETLKINVRLDVIGPADLLEALRPLRCLRTLSVCLLNREDMFDDRVVEAYSDSNLTLPDLPSLRELRVVGGIHTFLTVASPTLRKLDCTAGGKDLRLHLECPLLEDVLLPESRGTAPYSFGPCVVPFSGQFPCIFPHECTRSPQLCSTTGHTGCQICTLHHRCRLVGRTYIVGESCKGLYSTATWSFADVPGPTTSGPASLWRIPDGVRVTYCDRA
jgi:hypothetical protein